MFDRKGNFRMGHIIVILLLTLAVIFMGGSIYIWPSILMTLENAKTPGEVFGVCLILCLATIGIVRSIRQCMTASVYNRTFRYYWRTTIKNISLLPTIITWVLTGISTGFSVGNLIAIYFFFFLMASGVGFVLALVMSIIH